jgi:HEAT repeat protein
MGAAIWIGGLAALLVGAALSAPVLRAGERVDESSRKRIGGLAAAVLFPLLLLGSIWLLFRIFPAPYARMAAQWSGLAVVLAAALVLKRFHGAWWIPVQTGALLLSGFILVNETLLASAAAGGFPAQNPELCAWLGGRRAVAAIAGGMKQEDQDVRLRATMALGRAGKPAQPSLIAALRDSSPEVRMAAAGSLEFAGDADCVPALCRATEDPDPGVVQAACRSLGKLRDPRGARALVRALRTNLPNQLRNDIRSAIQIIGPDGVTAMVEALKDPDPAVRRGAMSAAELVSNGRMGAALLPFMTDDDPTIRLAAVKSVGDIARTIRTNQANLLIQLHHGANLVSTSDPDASRLDLQEVARRLTAALRDPQSEARKAAAEGLGGLRQRNFLAAGHELDAADPESEMPRLDTSAALPELVRLVRREPDSHVRLVVISALATPPDAGLVGTYIYLLHDPETSVRREARDALLRLKDPRVVPALMAAHQDPAFANPRFGLCRLCSVLYGQGMGERVPHPTIYEDPETHNQTVIHPEKLAPHVREQVLGLR